MVSNPNGDVSASWIPGGEHELVERNVVRIGKRSRPRSNLGENSFKPPLIRINDHLSSWRGFDGIRRIEEGRLLDRSLQFNCGIVAKHPKQLIAVGLSADFASPGQQESPDSA